MAKTRPRPHDIDESILWLNNGIHVPSRRIRLMGDIDDNMVEHMATNLAILDWQSQEQLTIYMTTGGGDELSGLAIYDMIKRFPAPTTIVVVGRVYSMGAIVLQAASHRAMLPSAALMIHVGEKSYDGHAENVRREVMFDKDVDETCDRILLERAQKAVPGLTLGKLRDMQTVDTYFNAKQAVRFGLADEVLS